MYLKSLSLKGFKSFPDRTRLEFGPGVSVIVGPNGSGKSNVTDAVLWALGEQSPLAVRGHSMQDIIFSGAPGRRAAGEAEVELVLDDSEGRLGLGPEVSIARRFDRSGEGEYRLAGARCRLVDVLEVLSDTGLGKEMHSVISQGRVEAIVTSKPRDRRMLIEEAAGLGKHRKRRRRAQLKLQRTQENLDRALDIEREARSRLRPLKRQAEAAEQHERLARQLLEAQWELARDEVRERELSLKEAETASGEARRLRAAVEAELRTVAKRREAAEEALAARSAQREELSRRLYSAQAAGERVNLRAESLRGLLGSLSSRLERTQQELEILREQALADRPDPDRASRIESLEGELAALDRDRRAELARQLASLEAELEGARVETRKQDEAVNETAAARKAAESSLEEARTAVRQAERAVEAARREAARVGGELAAVNQFLRSHATLPNGLRTLSDQIAVAPGYELAVAAALDGRLRAAVVDDIDSAAAVLDRTGADGGVALVLPAPGASSAAGSAGSHPPVPGAQLLAAFIEGAEGPADLARALLSETWVVESFDELDLEATAIAVTRTGRVWHGSARELRQLPRSGAERVLEERNRRDRLIADSEAAAQAELDARRAVEAAGTQMADLEALYQTALDAQRFAVRSRDEAAEQERRLTAQIERRRSAPDDGPAGARRAQLVAELSAHRGEHERQERERAKRTARLSHLDALLARDRTLLPAVERLLEALAQVAAAIEHQREVFDRALNADREESAHVSAELRLCAQQEAELQGRLHRTSESLTAAEVTLQRARDQLAEARTRLELLASRLTLPAEAAEAPLAEEERSALRVRVERLERRRELLGPVNPLAQEEYAEAVAHVEELEAQRTDLETALRELRDLIADTDRQISETFQETYAAAARNFEELAAQLFPGGRGQLRLVADGDGAPARTLGGEEPESAEDENEGEEDGPGAGRPEDNLGVEIEITPAGKDMKRLTLLSGGEKSMTALAFLFSVFLAKPCPFYILDEVEAALDDLNIDRFLELLRQNSDRAQFIVVTHQKRTMEAADSLYGVTMGGDGISKVISRRLPPWSSLPAAEAA